ncbi:hypothetical protein [Saccharopolyspora pogona]|uniref:hypothetical protein n=1 Tax=Saccharopolyspora pogona TaxID=333966 RepID=UPI001688C0F5|nr:hypothetical protein [Saccharopolyspora pogona]
MLEGHWCRLRHLGARRADQLVAAGAARQRLRDLLECAWPAVLATAGDPLEAITWRAALAVSTDPARIVDMGFDAFATAVRDDPPLPGSYRPRPALRTPLPPALNQPGDVLPGIQNEHDGDAVDEHEQGTVRAHGDAVMLILSALALRAGDQLRTH